MNHPDPIAMKVQNILRESSLLIDQSKSLSATAGSLLTNFECTGLVGNNGTAQAHYDSMLDNHRSLLNWVVDSAMRMTNATKGNLQIFDTASGVLRIVAHRGFKPPFLDFFKCVDGGESACGKAFDTGQRIIVEDVSESPVFYRKPALEVLLDARVRAVQSTPLVGSSGAILGVLSTHWPSPHGFSRRSWSQLDALAGIVGHWLETVANPHSKVAN